MKQINEQFLRTSMLSLLREILSDIGSTLEEREEADGAVAGKKGRYLKKLLIPTPLDAKEKEHFRLDYFDFSKAGVRPFCENTPEAESCRTKILSELAGAIKTRLKLSGPAGMQAAFFPTKERQFGTNQELTKNLQHLALNIVMGLEQDRILEKIESKNSGSEVSFGAQQKRTKLLEDLENGKVRLMEVDGEEQFITEDEVKAAASNPAYAGLSTVTGLKQDFRERKAEALHKTLENNGLEVMGDVEVDENGQARAHVKDHSGQELGVLVDTNAPNNDAHKFMFQFKGGALDGKSFGVSQDDLGPNFIDEKKEFRSAEAVYKQQPIAPEMPGQVEENGVDEGSIPRIFLVPHLKKPTLEKGLPEENLEAEIPLKTGTELPLYLNGKKPDQGAKNLHAKELEQLEGARIRSPLAASFGSVMAKKKALAQRPGLQKKTGRDQRGMAGRGGQGGEAPARAGQRANTPQRRKQKVPAFVKGIIGAGAGAATGLTGGLYWAATTDTDSAPQALHFILSCIG